MAINSTLGQQPAPRKRQGTRLPDLLLTTAYIGPALLGIFLLSIIPIGYTIYMSFTNRNGVFRLRAGRYEVVGLDNYVRLLGQINGDFYIVVGKTLLFTIICVVLFFLVGLILALVMNSPRVKFKPFWRMLLIVPWAVPSLVTALIWKFFFNQEFGTINNTLLALGLPNNIQWLTDPNLAFTAVVIVNLWLSYPFFMFIILGALQSIPQEVYEAADIDGASRWRQLRSITLPLLRPAVLPAVILSAITTFQMFNTVWLITEGGPLTRVGRPGATEFVLVYIYKQAFRQNLFALGSAFGVLVFFMLFALVLLNTRLSRVTRSAYD